MSDIITKFLVEKYIYNEKCPLNLSERYFLHYISYKIGKNKNCFMKQSTMVRDTGICLRNIKYIIKSLKNKQILVSTKKWKLNYYSINESILNELSGADIALEEVSGADIALDHRPNLHSTIDIDLKEIKEDAAASAASSFLKNKNSLSKEDEIPYEQIKHMFNSMSKSEARCGYLTPFKKKLIKERWQECAHRQNLEFWEIFFETANNSYFKGQPLPMQGWFTFLWLFNVENFSKVEDGDYAVNFYDN